MNVKLQLNVTVIKPWIDTDTSILNYGLFNPIIDITLQCLALYLVTATKP
mgnify:CR=1 FL=1